MPGYEPHYRPQALQHQNPTKSQRQGAGVSVLGQINGGGHGDKEPRHGGLSRGGKFGAGPPRPPPPVQTAVSRYMMAPVMCRAPECEKLFTAIEEMEWHFRESHAKPLSSEKFEQERPLGVESWESRRTASMVMRKQVALREAASSASLHPVNLVQPVVGHSRKPSFPNDSSSPRVPSSNKATGDAFSGRILGSFSRQRSREGRQLDAPHGPGSVRGGYETHSGPLPEAHSGPLPGPDLRAAISEYFSGPLPQPSTRGGSSVTFSRSLSGPEPRDRPYKPLFGPLPAPKPRVYEAPSGSIPESKQRDRESPSYGLDPRDGHSGPLSGPQPARATDSGAPLRLNPRVAHSESFSGPQPARATDSGQRCRSNLRDGHSEALPGPQPMRGRYSVGLSPGRNGHSVPFSGPQPRARYSEPMMSPPESQPACDAGGDRFLRMGGKIIKRGSLGWPFGGMKGEQSSPQSADRSHTRSRSRSSSRDLMEGSSMKMEASVSSEEGRRGVLISPPTGGDKRGQTSSEATPPVREGFLRRLGKRSFSPRSARRATEGLGDPGERPKDGREKERGERASSEKREKERGERASRSWSAPRSFLAAARARFGSPRPRPREEKAARRRLSDSGPLPVMEGSHSWTFFSRGSPRSPSKSGPVSTVEWPGVPRDGSPGSARRESDRFTPVGPTSESSEGGETGGATSEEWTPLGTPRKGGIGSKLVQALRNSAEFPKGKFQDDPLRASWDGVMSGGSGRSGELFVDNILPCDAAADCKMRFSTSEELELHRRIHHSVVPLWVRGNSTGPPNSSLGGLMGAGWLKKGRNAQRMGVFESALDIHNTEACVAGFESYRQTVIENAKPTTGNKFWKTPSLGTMKCKQDGNEVQRFYGTSLKCSLGINDRSRLCDSDRCELCCILRSGFKFKRPKADSRFGWGIHTSATVNSAHENYEAMEEDDQSSTKRAAILVCQVVAGRVCKLPNAHVVGPPQGYDSVSIQTGKGDDSASFDELIVFDKRALLPLYAIIYRPVDNN